jgi:hypothetical protein
MIRSRVVALCLSDRWSNTGCMPDEEQLWQHVRRYAGEPFATKTGKPFTYEVPGNYLRVTRDGM